jgi:hypothetical protein
MTRTGIMCVGAAAQLALSGCETAVAPGGGGNAAGSIVPPEGMIDECVRQIRVGNPGASISTRAPILAGPDQRVFVGLTVDGATWGCRIEDNGSFTAFPEFAN